jgi:hypothetical protein
MMFEVEGGTPPWCMKLLRHEAGHAFDHAYKLSRRDDWKEVFGSPRTKYQPYYYEVDPGSRDFVRNVPDHYAQAHPVEDFAETFAVWLNPATDWRKRYKGWRAVREAPVRRAPHARGEAAPGAAGAAGRRPRGAHDPVHAPLLLRAQAPPLPARRPGGDRAGAEAGLPGLARRGSGRTAPRTSSGTHQRSLAESIAS